MESETVTHLRLFTRVRQASTHPFVLPIAFGTVLISWYYLVQPQLGPSLTATPTETGVIKELGLSAIRTLSHLSERHLYTNVQLLLFTTITWSFIYDPARLLRPLSILFIVSIIFITTAQTTAVGSSLIIFGLMGFVSLHLIRMTVQTANTTHSTHPSLTHVDYLHLLLLFTWVWTHIWVTSIQLSVDLAIITDTLSLLTATPVGAHMSGLNHYATQPSVTQIGHTVGLITGTCLAMIECGCNRFRNTQSR